MARAAPIIPSRARILGTRTVPAVLLLIFTLVSPARGQFGATGWIEMEAWTFLYPLEQTAGCGGGGEDLLRTNWTAPFDVGTSDPRPGEVWRIDFGEASSSGWGASKLADEPTWMSLAWLEERLPDLGAFDPGDVVDFQGLADALVRFAGVDLVDDNVLAVAVTYVENRAQEPLPVELCVASDDSVQVLLNNKVVHQRSICRGLIAGCHDLAPAVLPPGISKIAVLVWEGGGGHGFRLGIRRGGELITADNNLVGFIGGDAAGARTALQYCAEREIEGTDALGCALVAGCDAAYSLVVRGKAPQGFRGQGSDLVRVTEDVRPLSGSPADIEIEPLSDGGEVEDIFSPPCDVQRTCALPSSFFVGDDAGGESRLVIDDRGTPDPADDTYTSASTSGADIWQEGDDFLFAFQEIQGDFDVAIEVLESSHSSGRGQWGKFGLMARLTVDRCSRFSMIQDHLPDLGQPVQFARRLGEQACAAVQAFAGPGGSLSHPRFQRLSRRGNRITAWVSNLEGLAEGTLDPCDDANWERLFEDDWGDNAPAVLLVGFANSEHESEGPAEQVVRFRLLCGEDQGFLAGKRVSWLVEREAVEKGLRYRLCASAPGGYRVEGEVMDDSGTAATDGASDVQFGEGAVGKWAGSEDVGAVYATGRTIFDGVAYSQTGQGGDIWANGDEFHFSYRPLEGDFLLSARVTGRAPPLHGGRWGKYGLMARYSCDESSGYHFLHANLASEWSPDPFDPVRTAKRTPHLLRRSVRELYLLSDTTLPGEGRVPSWMRLVRRGNAIYQYVAEDANGRPDEWVLLGSSADPRMPETLLAGVAVTSHAGVSEGISYDNLEVAEIPPLGTSLTCGAAEGVLENDFATGETLDGASVVDFPAGDAFRPGVVSGRLRILESGSGGNANAVWFETRGAGLGERGFRAEFDLFLSPREDFRADGIVFAVVETGSGTGEPIPATLDPPTLRGLPGGGLGYHGHTLAERVQLGHGGFGVEVDTWQGPAIDHDPNGANCAGCAGSYHVGLDLNGDVSSLARNTDLGVNALPDVFSAGGARFTVVYEPWGRVEVFAAANDGTFPETRVLSAVIEPLAGDLLVGFTGGTGGATLTAEVDDLSVRALCCEVADEVAITGPTETVEGEVVELSSVTSGSETRIPVFRWEVSSGPGVIVGSATESRVRVQATAPGTIVVTLAFGDGVCGDGASATHTIRAASLPCPARGDTICTGLEVSATAGPGDGETLAHVVSASASDFSGDEILYTFTADDGVGERITVGPQRESQTVFDLARGSWTITAFVDDDPGCDDVADGATCSVELEVPVLCETSLGYAETLERVLRPGDALCIGIPPPARDGADGVLLTLDGVGPRDENVLYARWRLPATPRTHDALGAERGPAQRLVLRFRPGEELFALIQPRRLPGGANRVRFRAELLDVAIESIFPESAANLRTVTATVHGLGFDALTRFELVHATTGERIGGVSHRLISSERVEASFAVGGRPQGMYDLVARRGGGVVAALEGGFELVSSRAGPILEAKLRASSRYRRNRERVVELLFRNAGDREMPAPIARLVGPEDTMTRLRLEGEEVFQPDAVELTLRHPAGPPGLLPPDADWVRSKVFFIAEQIGSGTFDLVLSGTDEVIASSRVTIVDSVDPNSKDGPVGPGEDSSLVAPDAELTYGVTFTNEPPDEMPESAAPAQAVDVSDVLDPDLAIESLEFGPVVIGSGLPLDLGPMLPCFADSECFEASADTVVLNAQGEFNVRVTARVDEATRELTWSFEPLDPLADDEGFLQVLDEMESVEAEGAVTFSLAASPPAERETEVRNEATITFDRNIAEQQTTNEVVNFIVLPPDAPVNPEPPDREAPPVVLGALRSIDLGWDAAGGVDTYDVFLWRSGEPEPATPRAAGLETPGRRVEGLLPATRYLWKVIARNRGGETEGAVWTFTTAADLPFVRGDVDSDGAIRITDAIVLLNFLFVGGGAPPCMDAADVDDSGGDRPNITDAIALLGWLFLGTEPPDPPTPSSSSYVTGDCGPDPTLDDMTCEAFDPCF